MRLESLSLKNFDSFSTLLSRTEFGGCYCAVWRSYDQTWIQRCKDPSRPNLKLTRDFFDQGLHMGFLVYENDELIGWTGSGVKTDFPILKEKLASRLTPFTSHIWSIGCIAIKENHRGKSKSKQIIEAVIMKAKEVKAEYIEAYPIEPWEESRSYRGSKKNYLNLGFEEFAYENDGSSKVLSMRLKL